MGTLPRLLPLPPNDGSPRSEAEAGEGEGGYEGGPGGGESIFLRGCSSGQWEVRHAKWRDARPRQLRRWDGLMIDRAHAA